jgi:ligand-binding SRPBCC domain-containing protein
MRLHRIHEVQRFPISLGEAWAFFSSPANLPLITPPGLALEVTSELPHKMYPGLLITYRLRPAPRVTAGWVTEITHMVEPHLFVDEQRFGPYRFWHHLHRFEEVPGGVEMHDVVHYALPFGPLGRLVHAALAARQLRSIFDFRRDVLTQRFGTAPLLAR